MDFNYEKLDVAKLAKKLILVVYNISKEFPAEERYGMISQLRRAAVSILLNIAEGNSRGTRKDYGNFVRIALGSTVETDCVLKIAVELRYISVSQYKIVEPIIRELYFKLIGLGNYLRE